MRETIRYSLGSFVAVRAALYDYDNVSASAAYLFLVAIAIALGQILNLID